MDGGHALEWLKILAKISAQAPLCLIPGHGELGTLDDVTLMERYINETKRMAERHLREGGSAQSAAALPPPAFTAGWANAESFARNMTFLHAEAQQ